MRADLHDRLTQALLSKPLVVNSFRGTVVEAIDVLALEPEWQWMADGWGEVDFRGPDGVGLEVKQSAALQNWHDENSRPCSPRFDIRARLGFYDDDSKWRDHPGRSASIYVFSWNPVTDPAVCDHRDPDQWEFYVIGRDALPDQKSLGLAGVKELAKPVRHSELRTEVARFV